MRAQAKDPQRGGVLLVVMMALVALTALGTITIVTVRSVVASATHDRFRSMALMAAEAGAAVAMDYVRTRRAPAPIHWTALVAPKNFPPVIPADLPGNGILPGQPGNLFNPDYEAWYEVEIRNNRDDGDYEAPPAAAEAGHQGYILGEDRDAHLLLRVTGHGPNNAATLIEIDIAAKIGAPNASPFHILGWNRVY
ncbi:MAG: hypothetical protein Tsb0020_20920 [Haliangiales bacterium]